MENLVKLTQIAVAIAVAYVWIFRFHNVRKEFDQFGLSLTTRSFVGASKIAIATLLVVGIWHPSLVFIPAVLMGAFMIGAQYFHFKAKNPVSQKLPSLVLLVLCGFIAIGSI